MISRLLDLAMSTERPAHWYLWVGLSTVFMWLFFWWSVGLAPSAFGGGFARAESVSMVRIRLLEADLLQLRIRQCTSTGDGSRTFYAKRIIELSREYRIIANQSYAPPPCDDVI